MSRELQEILDSGELTGIVTPVVDLTPQVNPPANVEGRIHYGSDSRSLNVKSNVFDATMNVGKELYVDVINRSGATIPNGTAVRNDGTDPSTGYVKVVPALADLLSTSIVGGITTVEILDQQIGLITTFGTVSGVDTSGFNLITGLYLSDTIPGGFSNDAPAIASRIGGSIDQLVDGKIFVNLENHTALPPAIAYMNTADSIDPINATPQKIVNYVDSGAVILGEDPLLGTITIPIDGIYRVSFTLSMTFNTATGSRVFALQLWDETNLAEIFSIPTSIIKDVGSYDFSTSAPFEAVAGQVLTFRVTSIGDIVGAVFQFTTFDIESVFIRGAE